MPSTRAPKRQGGVPRLFQTASKALLTWGLGTVYEPHVTSRAWAGLSRSSGSKASSVISHGTLMPSAASSVAADGIFNFHAWSYLGLYSILKNPPLHMCSLGIANPNVSFVSSLYAYVKRMLSPWDLRWYIQTGTSDRLAEGIF